MKQALAFIMTLILAGGCVDDFRDYNPPVGLDAPVVRVSTIGSEQMLVQVPVNAYQTTPVVYTFYKPVDFTVDVARAKGLVNDVSVSISIPEYGEVSADEASVNGIKGSESGSFKFTFTPNPSLPNMIDRTVNIDVSVADSQLDEDGRAKPVTTTVTIPVTLTTGCFSSTLTPGVYAVTDASGNLDGDAAFTYDDLVADFGEVPTVTITSIRPGLYLFNEVTGGIWPTYYSGRANPSLQLDLCNTTVAGHVGAITAGSGSTARKFTLNGTVNEDKTITVAWSYELVNGVTPTAPAKGTYTLTPISL
ncbi:MAG: hypothetical protein M3Y60_13905 [Bacteroidota bacterium]|nr:hypothetical protein [Bacteroidota bacterium]